MQIQGDEPSQQTELAALFEQYAPGILAYVRMHVSSPEDAEDVVVEVFLAALQNRRFASLSERAQLLWLWRVARNKTVDAYRYAKRRQHVWLDDVAESLFEPGDYDPEAMALQHENLAALQLHIKQLPAQQQEILRLRFGNGLSCYEIATRLGKQENAIRVTLSRSLNFLRRIYSQGEGGAAS